MSKNEEFRSEMKAARVFLPLSHIKDLRNFARSLKEYNTQNNKKKYFLNRQMILRKCCDCIQIIRYRYSGVHLEITCTRHGQVKEIFVSSIFSLNISVVQAGPPEKKLHQSCHLKLGSAEISVTSQIFRASYRKRIRIDFFCK